MFTSFQFSLSESEAGYRNYKILHFSTWVFKNAEMWKKFRW